MIEIIALIWFIVKTKIKQNWPYDRYATTLVAGLLSFMAWFYV
jgi:hypothetical protein